MIFLHKLHFHVRYEEIYKNVKKFLKFSIKPLITIA